MKSGLQMSNGGRQEITAQPSAEAVGKRTAISDGCSWRRWRKSGSRYPIICLLHAHLAISRVMTMKGDTAVLSRLLGIRSFLIIRWGKLVRTCRWIFILEDTTFPTS